jgi:AcrR family transcriptional regulator
MGLNAATIDAIAARAGVSRRTFFNYFASKEDAVLGTQPPVLPEAAIDAFDESSDGLFVRTLRLLAEVSMTAFRDDVDLIRRRDLAKRYPELRVRLMQHVSSAEQLVEALIEERVQSGRVSLGADSEPDAIRALLIVAGAAIRLIYSRNPSLASVPSPAELENVTSLFRTVTKEAP